MPRIQVFVVVLAVTAGVSAGGGGQTFEAVSIRVSRDSFAGVGLVALQPGRLLATEATLREMISVAYSLPRERVIGGPPWIASTRYNVTATTAGQIERDQARLMLQKLLADRFGLTSHREQRNLPIYALTVARKDGSLGPRLQRSGPECAPVAPPTFFAGAVPPPPPPPPPASGSPMTPLLERPVRLRCPSIVFPGAISARGFTLDEFTYRLSRFVARPVVDRTGLTGEFDIDLAFQSELAAAGPALGGPVGGGAAPDAAGRGERPWQADAQRGAPSVFSAMQDQLGLKLEATRAPIDVLVIDGVQQPAEN